LADDGGDVRPLRGLSSGIHLKPNCGIEGAKYDQLREARERIDGGLKEYGRATSEGKQGDARRHFPGLITQ